MTHTSCSISILALYSSTHSYCNKVLHKLHIGWTNILHISVQLDVCLLLVSVDVLFCVTPSLRVVTFPGQNDQRQLEQKLLVKAPGSLAHFCIFPNMCENFIISFSTRANATRVWSSGLCVSVRACVCVCLSTNSKPSGQGRGWRGVLTHSPCQRQG